jgi:hypothetical protein
MKQISSWIATMTFLFWGMLGAVILVRSLSPPMARIAITVFLPLVVVFTLLALAWFWRRRPGCHRGAGTLEEVRRQSRLRLAGEPVEPGRLTRSGRHKCGERQCGEEEQDSATAKGPSPRTEAREPREVCNGAGPATPHSA